MRHIFICFGMMSVAFFLACESSNENLPICTGSTCTCPSTGTCDIASTNCGRNSCTVNCENNVVCTGSCGASCSLKCADGTACDMTIGPSGSVNCTGFSICHIRCTGSCSLSCANGSRCDLQCADDNAPKPVTASATCQ